MELTGDLPQPPNLRWSDNDRSCGNCSFYTGTCMLTESYPVATGQLCDAWLSKVD